MRTIACSKNAELLSISQQSPGGRLHQKIISSFVAVHVEWDTHEFSIVKFIAYKWCRYIGNCTKKRDEYASVTCWMCKCIRIKWRRYRKFIYFRYANKPKQISTNLWKMAFNMQISKNKSNIKRNDNKLKIFFMQFKLFWLNVKKWKIIEMRNHIVAIKKLLKIMLLLLKKRIFRLFWGITSG